ncbi:hypothetical protein SDC9_139216 [bioreactor metagenome]|uniref:ABC transmembrane type-1 domain-containing protein n=1 Tax=bioreactor metagenome TaxID=1076179 RepID=A0A645DUQ9_9ZZZZ
MRKSVVISQVQTVVRTIALKIKSSIKGINRNKLNLKENTLIKFWVRLLKWGAAFGVIYVIINHVFDGLLLVLQLSRSDLLKAIGYGGYTFLRVLAGTLIGTLWTVPVGVSIGLNPKLARFAQPLIQIAASFPANMVFPFITLFYLNYHISIEIGAVPLMILGTQWYILFNVIAGALAIPNDLKEASTVLGLNCYERWKKLILPAIFPYLVTGWITASGGAWNASIVSEIVSWQNHDLIATGLGAYIASATYEGNWPKIIWGITVMALIVVFTNRLIWRKLYKLANEKFNIA